MRRAPLVATALIGVGLVAAPFFFSMFERGPKGAEMLDDFRPFMTDERIEGFEGHIALIDDAVVEAREVDAESPSFDQFAEQWPAIHADMSDLLTEVHGNVGAYQAVDALPSFSLFPWFFVLPGALIAVLSLLALRRSSRPLTYVVAGLGVGLVLAPAVFGMFTRAPKGGEMMDDFAGFMTRERVQDIQGYFGAMAVGQGGIRLDLVPALEAAGTADDHPAIAALDEGWVGIVNDMTPMIGAMSDNVDNYEAVAALPPFPLFPWFFVIPGVLVTGLALVATRPERKPAMSTRTLTAAPLVVVALLLAGCGDDGDSSSSTTAAETTEAPTETTEAAPSGELVGTIQLDPGACEGGTFSAGSYLQMVLPGGTAEAGPYFENPDSGCDDKAFTILEPGTDGGLVIGDYQPSPEPAFGADGSALADAIITPTPFTAIAFSFSSNPTDPQTELDVPAPTLTFDGEALTGDLSAVTASWNNEWFNQGSPKPDGSSPGLTSPVTGTYDPETGAITLEWASQVVGGPFNDFTGIWHLEGTFEEG